MANPYRGEVSLVLDGQAHDLRLTLGALAELEQELGVKSMLAVVERFENGAFSTGDVMRLLCAGLKGGGWRGDVPDLGQAEVEGGAVGAARVAARLLAVSFALVDEDV